MKYLWVLPWAVMTSTFSYSTVGGLPPVQGTMVFVAYKGHEVIVPPCQAVTPEFESRCGLALQYMADFVGAMNQASQGPLESR